ncbi:MAG TPA: dTDP-4-dehydrorhamnose 3,5-epimerase [Actinomycetes bacterium]|nr:dTDP-4-dehydrorhamnose 3,5-epimerase [Actinomycetes bacterium]
MIFTETELPGAFLVDLERHGDERGFFARTWCADEFAEHGLPDRLVQASVSFNALAGTLRGLHWQVPPHAEVKLVRVTAGAVWDVLVDLRPGSPTHARHVGVRLDARGRRAVWIPKGFAHGFVTLDDATEVAYQMTERHAPQAARGARYDDPAFGIDWPREPAVISPRDLAWPAFTPAPDPAARP